MKKYVDLLKNDGIFAANITHHAIHFEALSRGMIISIKNKKRLIFSKYGSSIDEIGRIFSIHNNNKNYLFNTDKILNVSNIKADELKKENMSETLKKNNFNYINKIILNLNEDVNYEFILSKLQPPLVVKPVNGTMGKGVYCNLKNKEELVVAIDKQTSKYMIEEYISDADEYRVYVIDSKVVALCKRLAPIVIGNGTDNIEELALSKNQKKIKMKLPKIKLSKNLDLTYIPKQDEKITLSLVQGRSSGSDIEVIASGIDLGIISEIERFSKLFKNHFVLGLDILVKDGKLYILEVNTRPQISSAILPDIGDGVDFPKILVDSLFGTSPSFEFKFSDFYNSYHQISKKIGIDWEEIQYQVVNGKLEKKVIL